MSNFRGFKSIHEIFADRDDKYKQELDAYLAAGWAIVDIHQRGYSEPQTNEETKITVYIMGHSDPQAVLPKWGDNPPST